MLLDFDGNSTDLLAGVGVTTVVFGGSGLAGIDLGIRFSLFCLGLVLFDLTSGVGIIGGFLALLEI